MMIHEKLMSGQFLLDLKNDHAANLLHAHSHASHHSLHALHPHLHHHQQQPHQQLPSPPMPAAVKMDLYSAYAYQQHLQQQLAGTSSIADARLMNARSPPQQRHQPVEVLDLSRRCDSMESPPPKTPSPYQSVTSSYGTGSPAHSPTNSQPASQQQTLVPSNLLYATQAAQQDSSSAAAAAALALPGNLAALYPGLYYPGGMTATPIKPDPAAVSSLTSITPPLTQAVVSQTRQISPVHATPRAATTNTLLQTFASAAAVAAAASVTAINGKVESSDDAPLSPVDNISNAISTKPTTAMATTPTSSTSASAALATLDSKTTRPFKAFPRDPLVIAANFAATDVLLDNPRVERYTEYRKRVLEQIRSSNGGSRTVTNPKMRRTNSRSGSINDGCSSSNNNSENDERSLAADESSDCDSNAGNFEKLTNSTGNNNTTTNNNNSNSNNTSSSSETNACNSTSTTSNAINSTSSMGLMGGSQVKDAAYYERRRKNNAAAKKSRDRRRIKEDEIAIRAAYLERQNIELLCQIDALKAQLAAFTSKVGA